MNAEDSNSTHWQDREPRKHSYTILLISLLLLMFLGPMFEVFHHKQVVATMLISVSIAAALYAKAHHAGQMKILVVFAVVAVILRWFSLGDALDRELALASDLAGLVFFMMMTVLMLRDIILTRSSVSMDLINGALAVYLLIGVSFAFLYSAVDVIAPTSFTVSASSPGTAMDTFLYFSFVTLTTLGYGDISPVREVARSLSMTEAIIGQIYLTVLVARLVGMHIAQASDSSR